MIYVIGKSIGKFGGSAFVAMDIADSLIESKIDVRTISVGYEISDEYKDTFKEIPHIKMPYISSKSSYPNNLYGNFRFGLKFVEYSFRWLSLKLQFRMNRPEIMIFNDTVHSTRDILEKYGGRSKLIQLVHVSPNFVEDFFGGYSIENCFNDFNKADVLLFVSDECRKKWLEYGELDEKKTCYIPNCAKEEEAHSCLKRPKYEVRRTLDLNPDSFYLIYVASVKLSKGQDLLLEAAPKLKNIAPNLEILIVGSKGGEYHSKLKETAEQKSMDFVRFTGRKPNAMEYIYASDLFVLPSRAEALPLVLLEAMILKTPMIGSNVGGVPEMIEHGKTGFLFESENVDELVHYFKQMYNNKEMRQKCAEQASKKYWNDFSKEQFTKRYVDLIQRILDR